VIAIISLNQRNKKARTVGDKVTPITPGAITSHLGGDEALSKRNVERIIDGLERHGILTRSGGKQGKAYRSWRINPHKIPDAVWEAEMHRSTASHQRKALRKREVIDEKNQVNGNVLLDAPTLDAMRGFAAKMLPNQGISDDQLRTIFDGRELELERQPLLWLRDILCSDQIDVN
jgi:hypothetical protein